MENFTVQSEIAAPRGAALLRRRDAKGRIPALLSQPHASAALSHADGRGHREKGARGDEARGARAAAAARAAEG